MPGAGGEDNATRCTLNTFGTFSTPTFAGVGEPYDDTKKSAPAPAANAPHGRSRRRPR